MAGTQSPEVLVVGAGPVGLTLACELARHGVPCRIVDKAEGPTDQSRALALWERTLEVFEAVGVIGGVLARGKRLHGMNIHADGRRIAHIGTDLEGMDTPYPFALSLPQSDTERLLIDRLAAHGLAVERRTSLVSLRQEDDGVTATLAGPDGGEAEAKFAWLVGCDGARSAVRHALGLSFEGSEYDERFLLADVRVAWDAAEDEGQAFLLGEGGAMAAFPLPEPQRWRLIDASGSVAADDEGAILDRFRALLHAVGHPEAVIDEPHWTASFLIHRRIAGRFRQGRCFVAGDAAHIHSPVGGQGMNTGIQDAHNLAWKLASVAAGTSPDSLLDSFEAERRPIAMGVLHGSDLATRVVTLRHPVVESARNALAGLLTQFEVVRRRIARALSELDNDYRRSPIVAEDHAPILQSLRHPSAALDFASAPRAGDRAPDVVLAGDRPSRLFEILRGPGHTLLLFEGLDHPGEESRNHLETLADSIRREHGDRISVRLIAAGGDLTGSTIHDADSALHRRYGAASGCLYLIRPDGFVGYRSQPADLDKLRAYLARLFVSPAG